ncbi:hypothetical protein [Streptomyces sp. NRRL S-1813]|uniref:hypothetical protein n=1 Tax=Streptomyces sp. NRRL S-1813 TaxID=1463888 RepID=UPI0004C67317|nr:hypothetical protein [Streptomyces sp. NRRL S-1813]
MSSPLSVLWRSALGSFRPTISADLPRCLAAQQRVADLHTQLARAEEFAGTLRERLTGARAR